ncbi:hypothetical protein V8B55DRAFT_1491676 [Mucor lusitanicus]
MLTKGLASCIVLDLIPTPENRELAKKTMEKSCFQVVYTGNEQDNPLNICKSLVEKNPHKFKAYPDTPPPSPQLAPTPAPSQSPPLLVRQPERAAVLVGGGGGGNNNLLLFLIGQRTTTVCVTNKATGKKSVNRAMRDKNQFRRDNNPSTSKNTATTSPPTLPKETKSNSSSSKPRNLITALRDNPSVIMRITKALFVRTPRSGDNRHRLVYASDQFIYNVLEQHIPISRVWTLEELIQALKDDRDYFEDYDQVISMRYIRLLYMVKENQQNQTVKKVLFDSIPNLCTYF